MSKSVLGCCVVFVWAISVCSQSKIEERGSLHVPEEQLVANRRLEELLKHPTFITLRLVSSPREQPREDPSDTPSPYTVDNWISFQLLVTQALSETLTFQLGFLPYYEFRPELYKNGDILAFSKEVKKRISASEEYPFGISAKPYNLSPGREYEWTTLSLEDWYGRLGPGHYQLTVRKRFAWDGDWAQSNSVTFDVQPRRAPKPIPDGLTIEVVPDDFQLKPKQKLYRLSGDIYISVVVVNNSQQVVSSSVIDVYYGNRPRLFKDGLLLPYQEEITKLIKVKENDSRAVEVSLDMSFAPNTRQGLQGLNLSKWYGKLGPGHYRLINRHRFEIDGPWTDDSAELFLEILP